VSDLTRRWSLAVLVCLLSSTVAAAQRSSATMPQGDRPLLGPQVGIGGNHFDVFIGGQLAYPVARQFDLYPSVQIYFPGNGLHAWGFNAAGRWWPPLNIRNSGLYVGGGINYSRASGGGFSHSSTGLALLGGWDFKAVAARPFVELRAVVGGDYDRIDIAGGINFKL
jgi:hypothetical protein